MTENSIKTRFAPSPTGLLHLGNIRTALFNALLAAGRGTFLLRIEDTDAARGEEKYEQALQQDLQWLGLEWDEGPDKDGGNGPYQQSERGSLYAHYFTQLQQSGLAYPCFCSEHELKLSRKLQLAAGKPPRYDGRCRNLTAEEVQQRFAEQKPATLRFHVVAGAKVEFNDKVRGLQQFVTDDIGDFVIRRSSGTAAFFFSNAIDDSLMQVSLVVRGEDHLTNTPRQILLLQALQMPVPEYAHIALVVGDDGAPLSKRHGSRTVRELRESGWLPIAIINYLSRLGHSYASNELMSRELLAAKLDMRHMHRSPARFDTAQLQHWQKEAVIAASDQQLWDWLCHYRCADGNIVDYVSKENGLAFIQTVRDNIVMPEDALAIAARLFSESDYLDKEARSVIREAGAEFFSTALDCLNDNAGDFKSFANAVGKAAGVKGKPLFMPLRASLTGETHGPEMARV